jgi:L-alanine-DL-glutamate epimerase-like enolase superfamily enzyme
MTAKPEVRLRRVYDDPSPADGTRVLWVGDLVQGAPTVDPADGCFALPTGPGLGVRLDRDAAARHPRTGVHFNLFKDGWE